MVEGESSSPAQVIGEHVAVGMVEESLPSISSCVLWVVALLTKVTDVNVRRTGFAHAPA